MSFFGSLFGGTSSRLSGADAWKKVEAGAVLVDVRTGAEYSGGHAKGAVNIPLQDLTMRLRELPKDKEIVVYCRSGARSASAASMLRGAGYVVHDVGGLGNL